MCEHHHNFNIVSVIALNECLINLRTKYQNLVYIESDMQQGEVRAIEYFESGKCYLLLLIFNEPAIREKLLWKFISINHNTDCLPATLCQCANHQKFYFQCNYDMFHVQIKQSFTINLIKMEIELLKMLHF